MLFKSCEFYPKPLDKSVSQPVKSDIPTLVFQSAMDVQTPLSWAQAILKTLNKGYYVEWSQPRPCGLRQGLPWLLRRHRRRLPGQPGART